MSAAEIGPLRFHDLRHSFGSLLIELGENIKYVQMKMGHSSIKVTMDIYGHLLRDANPKAAARLEDLINRSNDDQPEGVINGRGF